MGGRLQDRVAIITGAGSVGPGWGNGKATAVRFAEEGSKIFATDINLDAAAETKKLITDAGGTCVTHIADITKTENVKALVGACMDEFGRIDILHNNVGGSMPGGPADMPEDVWQDQIDHNLTHIYLMCRYVLPIMEEQGKGVIINMSSTSGIRYSGHPHTAYAATKAAIIQFSRSVAIQYAKKGIRCNSILPGLMHTPMVEARLAGHRAGGDVDKIVADRNAAIPMGWAGDGRDTANAALFLASDEARFITATEIIVDGGRSAASPY